MSTKKRSILIHKEICSSRWFGLAKNWKIHFTMKEEKQVSTSEKLEQTCFSHFLLVNNKSGKPNISLPVSALGKWNICSSQHWTLSSHATSCKTAQLLKKNQISVSFYFSFSVSRETTVDICGTGTLQLCSKPRKLSRFKWRWAKTRE